MLKHRIIKVIMVIFVFFMFAAKAHAIEAKLTVVYPKKDIVTIDAESSFLIGNTAPDSVLKINGIKTKVYPNGSFVKVVKLKEGKNIFKLVSIIDGQELYKIYTINVPQSPKSLPSKPLRILEDTITPSKALLYKAGDTIKIKFQGSPGYKATFSIGKKKNIQMKELPWHVAGIRGVYVGSYTIKSDDWFDKDKVSVRLNSKYTRLTRKAKATLSTMPEFEYMWAKVINDKATVRTMPDGSRLSPLPEGVIISITGKEGNNFRFMHGNRPAWINIKDIQFLAYNKYLVKSNITKIDVFHLNDSEEIKIPLTERLPVNLSQKDNQITLDIYGGIAYIDKIEYKQFKGYLKELKWSQPSEDVFRLKVTTNSKHMWGYDYYYEGNNLVLKLKKCPVLDANNPLKDQVIAIDPGHGADELGAIGPTEVPEKTVNLEISNYLKKELEKLGAKVIMTRTDDDINPDLYERSEIARDGDALVLISVHSNALPDGKDPYETHGASVYYYHSQALGLANAIQESLVNNLDLNNLGVFQGSLALTRPTEPISVLVEVAFMIHPEEYANLLDPKFQKKAAGSIKNGLVKYLKEDSGCVR